MSNDAGCGRDWGREGDPPPPPVDPANFDFAAAGYSLQLDISPFEHLTVVDLDLQQRVRNTCDGAARRRLSLPLPPPVLNLRKQSHREMRP